MIESFPEAKRLVPELRMIVVAGPRIDPGSLPDAATGWRSAPYVHDLYRHLAACDLAVVQGGLTTAMELTANRRPFLYFPLEHHFEQNFHVAPPARALRRRTADGLRRLAARRDRRGDRAGDRARGRLPPGRGDGAARAARLIAELSGRQAR